MTVQAFRPEGGSPATRTTSNSVPVGSPPGGRTTTGTPGPSINRPRSSTSSGGRAETAIRVEVADVTSRLSQTLGPLVIPTIEDLWLEITPGHRLLPECSSARAHDAVDRPGTSSGIGVSSILMMTTTRVFRIVGVKRRTVRASTERGL